MSSKISHKIKDILIENILTRWKYNKLSDGDGDVTSYQQHQLSLPFKLNSKQIEFALALMNSDEMLIFEKDYLDVDCKYWWRGYYSKATYYRIKNKAMDKFLNCLTRA